MAERPPLSYTPFTAPTQCLDVLIKAKLQEHYDFLVHAMAGNEWLRNEFGLEEDFRKIDVMLGAEVEFFVNSPEFYSAPTQEARDAANWSDEHVALVKNFRDKVSAKAADVLLPGTEWEKGGLSAEGRTLLEARTKPADMEGLLNAYYTLATTVREMAEEESVRVAPHSLHLHLALQQGEKRNLLYNPDAKFPSEENKMLSGALTSSVHWGVTDVWERARPLGAVPEDLENNKALANGINGIRYKVDDKVKRLENRYNIGGWAMHPELSLLMIFAGIRHGIESAETGDVLDDAFTLNVPFDESFRRMKGDPVLEHYLGEDLHKGLCEVVQHYPKVEAGETTPDALAEQMRHHPLIQRIVAKAKFCGVPLSPVRLPLMENGEVVKGGWTGRFPDKSASRKQEGEHALPTPRGHGVGRE